VRPSRARPRVRVLPRLCIRACDWTAGQQREGRLGGRPSLWHCNGWATCAEADVRRGEMRAAAQHRRILNPQIRPRDLLIKRVNLGGQILRPGQFTLIIATISDYGQSKRS
jgi:hypothetical protein